MYKDLIENILPEFFSFSQDAPFPQHPQTLTEIHEYLCSSARPYLSSGVIKLSIEVVRLEEVPRGGGWKVVVRDWNKGAEDMEVEENLM